MKSRMYKGRNIVGRGEGGTEGGTEVWVTLHGSGVHASLIRMMLKDPSSSTSHKVKYILQVHHVLSSKAQIGSKYSNTTETHCGRGGCSSRSYDVVMKCLLVCALSLRT